MVTKLRKINANTKASPVAIIISVLALLAFVGWTAYINLFAPPKPAPMDAKGRANRAVLVGLGKKCHGNMSLLSPEDQEKARKIAGGYAGLAIKMLYKDPNMGD